MKARVILLALLIILAGCSAVQPISDTPTPETELQSAHELLEFDRYPACVNSVFMPSEESEQTPFVNGRIYYANGSTEWVTNCDDVDVYQPDNVTLDLDNEYDWTDSEKGQER